MRKNNFILVLFALLFISILACYSPDKINLYHNRGREASHWRNANPCVRRILHIASNPALFNSVFPNAYFDKDLAVVSDTFFLLEFGDITTNRYEDITALNFDLVKMHHLPRRVLKCKNLERLALRADYDFGWKNAFIDLAKNNPKLDSLFIIGFQCDSMDTPDIPKEITLLRNLKDLTITPLLEDFPPVIKKLKKLERLRITSKTSDEYVFKTIVPHLPLLEYLDIRDGKYYKEKGKWVLDYSYKYDNYKHPFIDLLPDKPKTRK